MRADVTHHKSLVEDLDQQLLGQHGAHQARLPRHAGADAQSTGDGCGEGRGAPGHLHPDRENTVQYSPT